jgi:photosystem II stability/assembly factor-like uncharacterized protein
MKNILRRVVWMLIFCSALVVQAQKSIPPDLQQRLRGKSKLADIMKVVDEYYEYGRRAGQQNPGEIEESNEYIRWKRWEWWMSSHLDVNGNIIKNYPHLNYEALQQAERKWGAEINQSLRDNPSNANRTVTDRENTSNNNDEGQLAYGDWSLIGPTAEGTTVSGDIKGLGRFDRIAFHPSNANIIYLGAPTGNLWKTTDGGTTWASVTDGLVNPGVAGVAISPTNGNIVYILTGDGDSYTPGYLVYDYGSSRPSSGVFKSTDGGTSWTQMGSLYTGGDYEGHRLTISGTNGNYLFATTSQGIYRTTDGGTTWTQVKTGEHWDIEFKPGSDSTIYASSGSAIFYSTQGGRSGTWNTATTDFSVASAGRIELAVSAANSNYVYALGGATPAAGQFTGIFRSTNSGVDYTRRSNTPNILGSEENGSDGNNQGAYDLGITVKPTDASYLATCGLNVWVTSASNGGTTMVWSTKYREGYAGAANKYIHPDVHEVRYNPLNNYLYAATDGGFYRSTDDGTSWTNLSAGLATSQFYGMSMRDKNGNGEADEIQILAGAQDNGIKHRTTSGGSVFNHVICCDGYGTAISADNSNDLYYNINSSFYRSTNGGSTNTFVLNGTFFSPVAIDYLDPDTVYLGGTNTRRSFNGFVSTNLTIGTSTRRVLITCPSNQARLYGSAGTNLVRSDDRIATWTTKSGTAGWPAGTFTINDIDVYPTNSLEVYACFGGYSAGNKVMRSLNGGDSWTNWSGSLPNIPCYSLAVATEGVYVGTEFGVFFRGYSMSDWVPFYNQLPRTPVTEIIVNENGLVYCSTFGRGTWLSNRRSACAASLSISGSRTGPYYYEASGDIAATITTTGTTGDEIFAQAGNYVNMNPGFEIKAGSFFKAYVAPCSNGGIPTTARNGNNAETILLPRINEIRPDGEKPVSAENYFTLADGNILFHLQGKGKIEMLGKQKDGSWQVFYPATDLYTGFYYVPAPNAFSGEIKLLFNKRELKRL